MSSSDSVMSHGPLPYAVTIRVILDDDKVGSPVTWRGYAYSIFEAWMQASIETSGVSDTSKTKVESIGPDLVEYVAMMLRNAAAKELHGA